MNKLDRDKLINEIRARGVQISSIDDLIKINKHFRDLVPILLKYLKEVTDEGDKEFLTRCLGVRGFTEASRTLLDEFYSSKNALYKWTIGNSLSIICDEGIVPELVKIAQDKSHGQAREMVVQALGCYKDQMIRQKVKPILIKLLNDKEVAGHAISALSRMNDSELIKYIRPFEDYDVTWIRNEAKKAVKRLSKNLLAIM